MFVSPLKINPVHALAYRYGFWTLDISDPLYYSTLSRVQDDPYRNHVHSGSRLLDHVSLAHINRALESKVLSLIFAVCCLLTSALLLLE